MHAVRTQNETYKQIIKQKCLPRCQVRPLGEGPRIPRRGVPIDDHRDQGGPRGWPQEGPHPLGEPRTGRRVRGEGVEEAGRVSGGGGVEGGSEGS